MHVLQECFLPNLHGEVRRNAKYLTQIFGHIPCL